MCSGGLELFVKDLRYCGRLELLWKVGVIVGGWSYCEGLELLMILEPHVFKRVGKKKRKFIGMLLTISELATFNEV